MIGILFNTLDELMPGAVRWGSFDSFVSEMQKAKVVVPPLEAISVVGESTVADVAAHLQQKPSPQPTPLQNIIMLPAPRLPTTSRRLGIPCTLKPFHNVCRICGMLKLLVYF